MEPILTTIEQPAMETGLEVMNEMFQPEVVAKSANIVDRAFMQGLSDIQIPEELVGAAAGLVVGLVISGLIQLGFNAIMKERQVPPCGCGCTAGTIIVPLCTAAGFFIAMSLTN